MKKTQKRFFGFFGLLVVAIVTIVAIIIPGPGASANSITDNITVRVIGGAVDAKFQKPSTNTITTDGVINYIFNYENADAVRLSLAYTNEDGTVSLPNFGVYNDLDYAPGTVNQNYDVTTNGFSYGNFLFSLYATGTEGTELLYDSVQVEYLPAIASAGQNDDDGLVHLDIDSFAEDVETIEIYLGDELITTVDRDDFDKVVKFALDGKESGEYTVKVVSKDADGNVLYEPYDVTFDYEGAEVPNTNAPDTGFFFQNLNISKEDYLITGLLLFFTISIVAFGIVARGSKRK